MTAPGSPRAVPFTRGSLDPAAKAEVARCIDGAAVGKGAPIAEIAATPQTECVGISKRDKLIARSVGFVIEIERSGVTPISLESFLQSVSTFVSEPRPTGATIGRDRLCCTSLA